MTATVPGLEPAAVEDAARAVAARPRSPWYIEMFLAFGGWLAALFAIGSIYSTIALIVGSDFNDNGIAALGMAMGAGVAFGGVKIGGTSRDGFVRHVAVAAIAAGLTSAIGGLWYLINSFFAQFFSNAESATVGVSGLIACLALAGAGFVVARHLRDAILTFLTTFGVYAIFAVSIAALAEGAVGSWTGYQLASAPAALAGFMLFTRPVGKRVHAAAGAALLIGPALFAQIETFGWGVFNTFDSVAVPVFVAVLMASVVGFCLWTMRGRYPLIGLLAAGLLLLAAVWVLPHGAGVAIVILCAGFAANHRGLAAIGVVLLTVFIVRFYYDLSMTLLDKSALMAALGSATLAGAFVVRRFIRKTAGETTQADDNAGAEPGAPAPRRAFLATLGGAGVIALALGLVNRSVWRLETAFRDARAIYLPLAPVDPRSLIQGDYMTIRYDANVFPPAGETPGNVQNGAVFLTLNENAVASFSRIAGPDDTPGPDEIRVVYFKRGGAVHYCADEFFFQEGDAPAYARARFAVVLISADGNARLVDLADENRAPIDPAAAPAQGAPDAAA